MRRDQGTKGQGADVHLAHCGPRHRCRAMGNGAELREVERRMLLVYACGVRWGEGLERSSEISLSKINILKIPGGGGNLLKNKHFLIIAS